MLLPLCMARAVVTWAGSGSPDAFRKTVRDIPSERAVLVMRAAKSASEPLDEGNPRSPPYAYA